jgi:four helix bundle protein
MNEEAHSTNEKGNLSVRTKAFALRIIKVYEALPQSTSAQVIGKQFLRSGTSVGAHYREGSRARSKAEFISKLEVGLQELEETKYWLELLVEGGIVPEKKLVNLLEEAEQLTAMLAASVRTTKLRKGITSR